jgi:hypothetical protein
MKKELFNQSLLHMEELSVESCEMINGGETLWYWLAYGVGSISGWLRDNINGHQSGGQQVYNAALG